MEKRNVKSKKWLGWALGGAALVGLLAIACDSRPVLRIYAVETEKLSAPVRLAVLADLHSCDYGQGQRDLLDLVEGLDPQPDAVLLAGDIVDDVLPRENAFTALEALAGQYPCFYVTGNHEYWSGQAEDICRRIADLGVTVLRGEAAELAVNGQTITLCGIDDPESGEAAAQLAALPVEEGDYTVLLAHRPEAIGDYLQYPFDLIVSGHAHGGQWRIPGLVNGLYAPNQGWFPPYAGGLYIFESASLVVSRGLARESTRIPRIFNPPELVVIELTPA